jgi:tRNA pseudouridine38-40 synthase
VRLRLDLGYDGTDFAGWAAQPGRRTVAGTLTGALERLFGPAGSAGRTGLSGLTVAGRTDAGVHATGQVCHVDVDAGRWAVLGASLLRRLNGLLPPQIRVSAVEPAAPGFDARFSATFRRYAYRIGDAPFGVPPLGHRYALAWPRPVDLALVNQAASRLLGEHDFAAYCRRKERGTTVRTVLDLHWQRGPDGLVVAGIRADAFCQAMVRSLVGALLAVSDGRRPVGWPASLLDRSQRADEVWAAPPHGLVLVEVGYPEDPAELADQAGRTRRLRAVRQP